MILSGPKSTLLCSLGVLALATAAWASVALCQPSVVSVSVPGQCNVHVGGHVSYTRLGDESQHMVQIQRHSSSLCGNDGTTSMSTCVDNQVMIKCTAINPPQDFLHMVYGRVVDTSGFAGTYIGLYHNHPDGRTMNIARDFPEWMQTDYSLAPNDRMYFKVLAESPTPDLVELEPTTWDYFTPTQ